MSRETILDHWLGETLKSRDFECQPLSGDASFRKYYRLSFAGNSYVVMDAAPPETPNTFIQVAKMLDSHGLSVPRINASELDNGFLLLTDFGDRLYLKELNEHSATSLYRDALDALIKMQQCQGQVPIFEKNFLERQMAIFVEWYLGRHLDIDHGAELKRDIDSLLDKLLQVIEAQPRVFVHRDYHSRNLMILEAGNPGILDFQDAMLGPITYDLVSLLQDCYIRWPRPRVEAWAAEYQDKARAQGLLSGRESREEFLRWMDLTGLQRHLKNLGIFARLCYRDGKTQYLNDIPMVIRYILEAIERYPELNVYSNLFESVLKQKETRKCMP